MKPRFIATVLGSVQSAGGRPHTLRTILIVTALGLALQTVGFAQAAPPVKPTKPTKPAKTAEENALQKAIDAVNRGAEKAKATDESPAKPGTTGDPHKPGVPKPPVSKPAAPNSSDAELTRTWITGEEGAELDNKSGLVIFRKNVLVDRPDLKIYCDELTITMNQAAAKKPGAATAPEATGKPESADALSSTNIKQAVGRAAPGNLVVIWRKTEQGEVVAIAHEATYIATTGTITIKGTPEAMQDLRTHISSPGQDDEIVLLKNGNARGWKSALRTNEVEGKEIRRRMLSHIPASRRATAIPEQGRPVAVSPTVPPPRAAPPLPTPTPPTFTLPK